jgi:hypothetical protein
VDQALGLFEWIKRENDGGPELPTQHHAEMSVLWTIEAQLEKTLVEPFSPDYVALIAAARERLVAG